ncbi:peptidoglycan-binding domain-containing protein [Actinomadura harenae]|nr:peptidoglycan-binding protein [Actinomadura harenae]
MTTQTMLASMRTLLGLGEPNHVQRWYQGRNGADYAGNPPWCDEAITWAAAHSQDPGDYKAVCPKGDRAYTVYHAQDYQRLGEWHIGTADQVHQAMPGDIVFFDWSGSNDLGAVDHVGICEVNLGGGLLQTIEGNTSDACKRRVRDASVIAGFGRPPYRNGPAPTPPKPGKAPRWPGRFITQPPIMTGPDVRQWQQRIRDRGWKITVDGAYGPNSEAICRAFQREKGLQVDGVIGPDTWRAAWASPVT